MVDSRILGRRLSLATAEALMLPYSSCVHTYMAYIQVVSTRTGRSIKPAYTGQKRPL